MKGMHSLLHAAKRRGEGLKRGRKGEFDGKSSEWFFHPPFYPLPPAEVGNTPPAKRKGNWDRLSRTAGDGCALPPCGRVLFASRKIFFRRVKEKMITGKILSEQPPPTLYKSE